jgi:8-oxo-dGTP diphosphatase
MFSCVNTSQIESLPPDVYFANVPRKRMAAGALCRDQAGRVLLVDPVYRDTMDIPGGMVEAEESPRAACRREVAEEVGLDRAVGRLLVVDWVPSQSGCPEEVVMIYDGGVLGAADIEAITVPSDELSGFSFVPPKDVAARVRPVVEGRIRSCLSALAAGTVASLENGNPV